ncbi:hypothetical protein BpHYR1_004624 [Brachionus plicatilis]|uniref:SH3 domain-containing protein n=1 Tax=Brachionus plicatilis TaxID=10195 RepID=A0A3M7S7F6_BRAPC|nr:hypothetical protein BpHYR1_004624 [Brachionus plicatilis]
MTQHFKQLMQQIQPLLYNTPFSQAKKPEAAKSRRELAFANKDSGLDTTCSSSPKKKGLHRSSTHNQLTASTCRMCACRNEQKVQMRKKLKKSYVNYMKSDLSESQFANIPLVVAKSFRPTSDSLNKLQVRKGCAVNALYMIDNKWIYVKTTSEKCGFIPAKCCQPFDLASKCRHVKSIPNMKLPDLPVDRMDQQEEHTYVSVDQNMYEKLASFESEQVVDDYGLLAEAESMPVHQYDCLMTYTPKVVEKNNEQNYYNISSGEKKTPNLYKVRKEFKSTFAGGISLSKGDLVYMVNTSLSSELKVLNKQNLVFVRVYKRFAGQQYENINRLEPGMLQGFVPSAYLVKLNDSNQNSPIYC